MPKEIEDIIREEIKPYVDNGYWGELNFNILLQNGRPETVKVNIEKHIKLNTKVSSF